MSTVNKQNIPHVGTNAYKRRVNVNKGPLTQQPAAGSRVVI